MCRSRAAHIVLLTAAASQRCLQLELSKELQLQTRRSTVVFYVMLTAATKQRITAADFTTAAHNTAAFTVLLTITGRRQKGLTYIGILF